MKMLRKRYRKAVFVVVYSIKGKEIKYLVLKRKYHWRGWEFPKGGIDKGESEKQAAIREAREETGTKILSVKNMGFKGEYKYKKSFSDRPFFTGQTFSLYAAESKIGKVSIDKKEHSGYKWLVFEKARKKLTWQNQKKSLDKVNKWLEKKNRSSLTN